MDEKTLWTSACLVLVLSGRLKLCLWPWDLLNIPANILGLKFYVQVTVSYRKGPWVGPWEALWRSPPTSRLLWHRFSRSAGPTTGSTSSPLPAKTSLILATSTGSRWIEARGHWSSETWCWRTAGSTPSPWYQTEGYSYRGASCWTCTVGLLRGWRKIRGVRGSRCPPFKILSLCWTSCDNRSHHPQPCGRPDRKPELHQHDLRGLRLHQRQGVDEGQPASPA